jgi:hypothetical protein
MILVFVPEKNRLSYVSKNTLEFAFLADRFIKVTSDPEPQLIVKLDHAENGPFITITRSNDRLPEM